MHVQEDVDDINLYHLSGLHLKKKTTCDLHTCSNLCPDHIIILSSFIKFKNTEFVVYHAPILQFIQQANVSFILCVDINFIHL